MNLKVIFMFILMTSSLNFYSLAWRRRRRRCDSSACTWVWTSCSRSCGGGAQSPRITRQRGSCGPACNLPGIRSCNNQCCPINCQWGAWGNWGSCSQSCGGGISTRTRGYSIINSCGGNACSGSTTDTRKCSTGCCPINCQWGAWGNWGSCSQSCGGGISTRTRGYSIINSCGGNACSGSTTDTRKCSTGCCPINCQWGAWGNWGSCSQSCGGGISTRIRGYSIINSCGGNACSGSTTDTRKCSTSCCPINCQWGAWGNWGLCSTTCGSGLMTRKRLISTPRECEGEPCLGLDSEQSVCTSPACPIRCSWGLWESWEECSITCGAGNQTRHREVMVRSQNGGAECEGESDEKRYCNTECCPVNCIWGEWKSWGDCSRTCERGSQSRERSIHVLSQCGGVNCNGDTVESQYCNDVCCPVDCVLSEWSDWGSCNASCGMGSRSRRRVVTKAVKCGGKPCNDMLVEHEACNMECCPVNCSLSKWENWSSCSSSCGSNGISMRQRSIKIPSACGGMCFGDLSEIQNCNIICLNGGEIGGISCLCPRGWEGACCEADLDECQSSPCQTNMDCQNTLGSFICSCKAGFDSNGFVTRKTYTMSAGGVSGSSGEEEADTSEEEVYMCIDLDECQSNPCGEKMDCENTMGSFFCSCKDGYAQMNPQMEVFSGNFVEKESSGNSLDRESDGNSLHGESSGNFPNKNFNESFHDRSSIGKVLSCVDVDECVTSENYCHTNATCRNTIGSYRCQCKQGYTGDGVRCSEFGLCLLDTTACDPQAACVASGEKHVCVCKEGFTGDGRECLAVDQSEEDDNSNDEAISFDWMLPLYVVVGVVVGVVVAVVFAKMYKKQKQSNKKAKSYWVSKDFTYAAKSSAEENTEL